MIIFSMECCTKHSWEDAEIRSNWGDAAYRAIICRRWSGLETGYSTIVRLLNDYMGSELWLWNCVFRECFWSCAIRVEQHVFIQGIMFVGFCTFFWTYSSMFAEESQQCSVPSRWWTCWYFQHSGWSYLRDFRLWQSSDTHHASACGRHVPALRLPSDDERLPKRRSVRLLPHKPSTHHDGAKGPKANSRQNQTKAFGDFESTGRFRDLAAISGRLFFLERVGLQFFPFFSRALLILLAGTTP